MPFVVVHEASPWPVYLIVQPVEPVCAGAPSKPNSVRRAPDRVENVCVVKMAIYGHGVRLELELDGGRPLSCVYSLREM